MSIMNMLYISHVADIQAPLAAMYAAGRVQLNV